MADAELLARSPLAGMMAPGRFGATGPAGVVIEERPGCRICEMAARAGQQPPLADAMRGAYGIELPVRPRRVEAAGLAAIWAGPARWLIIAEATAPDPLDLRARLGVFATFVEQGDGRCVLRIGGARARDTLAKGIGVDLHPRVFAPGDVALTSAARLRVELWQLDAQPTYEIAVSRSYAESFLEWLRDSAAEFGVEIVRPE